MSDAALTMSSLYVNVSEWLNTSCMSTSTNYGQERSMPFQRALRDAVSLLFVGDSSFGERQLARHLENVLLLDTMCEIHVIVFLMNKLRARPALQMQALHSESPGKYLN